MDANLIIKTIQTYLKILEKHSALLLDLSILPFSKETLKRAIQTYWFVTDDPNIREELKIAYIRLADFQMNINKYPEEIDGNLNIKNIRIKEMENLKKDVKLWEQDEFE